MQLFHVHSRGIASVEDFSRFYEQTHLSVFRYLMILCSGNQAEAEEITADAYFRAWEKRQQFSGSTQAALGWVITIARNILIDQRRSAAVHPNEIELDETFANHESSIEEILVSEEQTQQVLKAINDLPFAQREILTLRYGLGWRVKTIADHLGIAENTVSVDLRRAIAKLQKQLIPQANFAREASK